LGRKNVLHFAVNVSDRTSVCRMTDLRLRSTFALVCALSLPAADPPMNDSGHDSVRATGIIRAVQSVTVLVPRIEGLGGNLTLATLVENGTFVKPGDLIASFDRANELKLLQDAQSKFDDQDHQIEQKKAEHLSNAEKRVSDLTQAQADLKKAEIESRKGPVLSAIDQEKNRVNVETARAHLASLEKSNRAREIADKAELRVLELQRDRQKVAVERQIRNSEKLMVKAPIRGMVALQNVYRNNSMGHAQEGDQVWPGSPLLKLFDPTAMEVEISVGEPDGAVLVPGAKATVHLDAFPDTKFTAHYSSASPVATSALGMSVKTFLARFRLDQSDPRLLPDLSAAIDIEAPNK
jgi:HlyD family secretion protein